jgi:hypothetical protein
MQLQDDFTVTGNTGSGCTASAHKRVVALTVRRANIDERYASKPSRRRDTDDRLHRSLMPVVTHASTSSPTSLVLFSRFLEGEKKKKKENKIKFVTGLHLLPKHLTRKVAL